MPSAKNRFQILNLCPKKMYLKKYLIFDVHKLDKYKKVNFIPYIYFIYIILFYSFFFLLKAYTQEIKICAGVAGKFFSCSL